MAVTIASVLAPRLSAAVLAALVVQAAPVSAGGSVSLADLMELTKGEAGLQAELKSSLSAALTDEEDVQCTAMRLGRHFGALGGARVGPYECEIGGRILEVETEVEFVGPNGLAAEPEDAESVRESKFKWSWRKAR
jgi:hypothetical protein